MFFPVICIVNKKCQPRLIKFYTPVDLPNQKRLLNQVYELISQRNTEIQSSFLVTPPLLLSQDSNSDFDQSIQIIYKNYATLYFTFIVDDQESELAMLDLIQTFVEALDKCFTEVNELDLIFNWQTLQSVLDEIIQGGMVIETNVSKIVSSIDELNRLAETSDNKVGFAIGNAFQALTQSSLAQWASRQ